jgi:PTS system nitrogen regulatory IIA component
MNDLIVPAAVLARLQGGSRRRIIETLCDKLVFATGVHAKVMVDAVMRRERLGPSGLSDGVALPHAQVDGLETPVCAFARLDQPVCFEALDGVDADLVLLLVTPPHGRAVHLKALARIARFLRAPGTLDRLRDARGRDDLLACFGVQPALILS